MRCMLCFCCESQRVGLTGKYCWHSHCRSTQGCQTTNKCERWAHIYTTQAKSKAHDRGLTGEKILYCKKNVKSQREAQKKKKNTLRSRLSRCKSSAPLTSWRMKISLYSPKLSRSSQAATSSVPQFWTTKVKSKTPLMSTCAMRCITKQRSARKQRQTAGGATKGAVKADALWRAPRPSPCRLQTANDTLMTNQRWVPPAPSPSAIPVNVRFYITVYKNHKASSEEFIKWFRYERQI